MLQDYKLQYEYTQYVVDDDLNDNEIIKIVWHDLNLENKLEFFTNGHNIIERLQSGPLVPFIIICDLNLPGFDGFEIREKLYNDLRYKTVPFIFWSNSVSKAQVKKACDLGAHGMFIKGSTLEELKATFTGIVTTGKPA